MSTTSTISPSSPAHLEPLVIGGGPSGDEFLDHRLAVVAAQGGADALQLQTHGDFKFLERLGRHVARMRIERVRQRDQVGFEQIIFLHAIDDL
jgi:hypothetical protein